MRREEKKDRIDTFRFDYDERIELYLDGLAEEYKELLWKRLLEESGDKENLSVSELLRIDSEIKKPLFSDYRRRKRFQDLIMKLGVCYTLLGLIMLLVFNYRYPSRYEGVSQVSYVVIIVGLSALLSSIILPIEFFSVIKVKSRTEENRALYEYMVIKKWKEFERIVADIYPEESPGSPRVVIAKLERDSLLTRIETDTLFEFLKLRNVVVHNTDKNIDVGTIQYKLKEVQKVLDKLQREML